MTETGAAARRLLSDFVTFAGKRLWALAALMIGGAIAEGVGIVTLVPLLALAVDPSALPPIVGGAVDHLSSVSQASRFGAALALFLGAMAARAWLLYRRDLLTVQLGHQYDADLKLRSAASLAELGWSKASRVGLAGMQNLLLTEIPRCVLAVHEGQIAAIAAVMLLVQFTLAALLSPSMAALALVIVLVGIGASWGWLHASSRRGVAISAHGERSGAAGFRLHSGLKAALAQGTTAQFLDEYRHSLAQLAGEVVGYGRDRARVRALASVAAAAAAALLLVAGQLWLHLPFTVLATLLVLFARMSGPAQSLQQSSQAFMVFSPAYAVIEQSLGDLRSADPRQADVPTLDWNELRLERVSFTHSESGFRVEDVSLSLHRGEWLGIAGPSGCGKTTLIDLATILFPPESGQLMVDDAPLEGPRVDRWRRALAYVGQSEMTFDDSVRRNLLAGSGEPHDDEQLWAVLELAGLAERVRALPQGLDAQVGDRGSSLSGGERQRLAIARAVLRRPTLLILDEATNALDPASEEEIVRRLQALQPRPAALVVAHRDRPLELCDRVVRVDAGRLA